MIQNAVRVISVNKIHKSHSESDLFDFETRHGVYFIGGGNQYVKTNAAKNDDVEFLTLADDATTEDIIDKFVVDLGPERDLVFAKDLDRTKLDYLLGARAEYHPLHPRVQEAMEILRVRKESVLDMIVSNFAD